MDLPLKEMEEFLGILGWEDPEATSDNDIAGNMRYLLEERGADGKLLRPMGICVRPFKGGYVWSEKKIPVQYLNRWWKVREATPDD